MIKRTIQEYRLAKGLTLQAAAILSKIPARTIKRWEQSGAGKVNAFLLSDLLEVYGTKLDFTDFNRTSTGEEIITSILIGSGTVNSSGQRSINLDKAIELMKGEGVDIIGLEKFLMGDKPAKTKAPQNRGNGLKCTG